MECHCGTAGNMGGQSMYMVMAVSIFFLPFPWGRNALDNGTFTKKLHYKKPFLLMIMTMKWQDIKISECKGIV